MAPELLPVVTRRTHYANTRIRRTSEEAYEPRFARGNWRVYEVPISYHGRTYEEGKKIGWKDGVRALYVIAKYTLKR